ncbi:Dihydrofolate reductase type 3 [bacterium HR33]|nr:Dihydrofolate reductase type 3 [bacterium HR33]
MAENRVIGRSNGLPWHLPADLRRFKELTMGHTVIMGRRTFESIGRLLPGRRLVVLTRNASYSHPGIEVAGSLDEALELAREDPEVFVAGGGEIFRLALPRLDRVYLTVVHAAVEGDTTFPELAAGEWRLVEDVRHSADERNPYDYSFRLYRRVR